MTIRYLLRFNSTLNFQTAKINSLRQLALGEVSACGRNWYLTEALVEEGLEIKPTEKQIKQRINSGSLHDLFLLLSVMLDLEKTIDVVETVCFHFTDVDKTFVFKVCIEIILLTVYNFTISSNFLTYILILILKD